MTPLPSRPMSIVAMLALGVVCLMPRPSDGHGYLYEPPGRSSMWRRGYKVIANTNDMENNCGGFTTQQSNGGKCGVCGDDYSDPAPRANEVGGKYADAASRFIVGNYKQGQSVEIKVLLTAQHKGWIGFKLCPTNSFGIEATQTCLDQHPLATADGTTKFMIDKDGWSNWYNVTFILPADMTCNLCVLQWRYHTGNSWGKDPGATTGCQGCGPQEEFYACADVSIGASGNGPATSAPATPITLNLASTIQAPVTQAHVTQAPSTQAPVTQAPVTQSPVTIDPATRCKGVWPYDTPKTDIFCEANCKAQVPFCPPSHCRCGGLPRSCVSTGAYAGLAGITNWCNTNCNSPTPYCPSNMCDCN